MSRESFTNRQQLVLEIDLNFFFFLVFMIKFIFFYRIFVDAILKLFFSDHFYYNINPFTFHNNNNINKG